MNAADRQRIYVEGLKAKVVLLEQTVATQKSVLEDKHAEIARLRAALKPFAEFARRFNLRPIPNAERADILYGIHAGEKDLEADIHLSDCRAALKALE